MWHLVEGVGEIIPEPIKLLVRDFGLFLEVIGVLRKILCRKKQKELELKENQTYKEQVLSNCRAKKKFSYNGGHIWSTFECHQDWIKISGTFGWVRGGDSLTSLTSPDSAGYWHWPLKHPELLHGGRKRVLIYVPSHYLHWPNSLSSSFLQRQQRESKYKLLMGPSLQWNYAQNTGSL